KSGLDNSAIHRLTDTWEGIDDKDKEEFDLTDQLITKNYNLYRTTIDKCYADGEQCAPCVATYLTDLVFVDSLPNTLEGKINFLKAAQMYNIMFRILRFQGRPFSVSINWVKKIILCLVSRSTTRD